MEKELQVNGFKLHAVYNDELLISNSCPDCFMAAAAVKKQRRIIVFRPRRREPVSQHWHYSFKACAMIFRH